MVNEGVMLQIMSLKVVTLEKDSKRSAIVHLAFQAFVIKIYILFS